MIPEWTPFMRDLQKRIAAGRLYLAAHPESDDAMRRIRAIGLWLASEVVNYRMEVGLYLYWELPVDQKRAAEVRLWAQQVKKRPGKPFPARMPTATEDAILDRIYRVLGARRDRYFAAIQQLDPGIEAEMRRECERRYRDTFGSDAEYQDAKDWQKSFAREKHYAQAMLTAEVA